MSSAPDTPGSRPALPRIADLSAAAGGRSTRPGPQPRPDAPAAACAPCLPPGPPAAPKDRPREVPLRTRALSALARREYTRAELQAKLAARGPVSAELDGVLTALQEQGLLSDERAAASLARQKAGRFGLARIRRDLTLKGVPPELIETTLAPLAGDEWQRARRIWQARFGNTDLSALDWRQRQRERARQARFMSARGFSQETVMRLLADHGSDDDDDNPPD